MRANHWANKYGDLGAPGNLSKFDAGAPSCDTAGGAGVFNAGGDPPGGPPSAPRALAYTIHFNFPK